MSEKPMEIIFVGPEAEVEWDAHTWSLEDIKGSIHSAYEAWHSAMERLSERSDSSLGRFYELLQRAASESPSWNYFSKTDLIRLTDLVEAAALHASSELLTKGVKGPILAKDVRALFERALRLAEVEAGTSER